MTEIILDSDFALKLVNDVLDMQKVEWYKGYWYWMTDSKYRVSTRLDKFLYDQIHNTDDKLSSFASKFATFLPDRCIIAILKEVLKKVHYLSDYEHFGKTEYWQPASLTLQSGQGDCFPLYQKIIVRDRKDGTVCIKKFSELENNYLSYDALSVNESNNLCEWKNITSFIHKGRRMVSKVKLKSGSFICTNDHRFLIESQLDKFSWKRLSEIDYTKSRYWCRNILSVTKMPCGTCVISDELANFIGSYVADGWTNNGKYSIAGDDKQVRDNLHKSLNILGIKYSQSKRDVHAYTNILKNGTPVEYIKLIESMGSKGIYKKFPDIVMRSDEDSIRCVLRYYSERDGSHTVGNLRNYSTVSDELKEQLKILNMMLGIRTSCHTDNYQYNDAHRQPIHRLYIYPNSKKTYKGDTSKNSVSNVTDYMEDDVCDITVADNHNFILDNGIIAHNCEDINSLIYITARLAGIPSYRLWNVIGNAKVGDSMIGHYWLLYIGSEAVYVIDGAYNPDTSEISMRTPFKLSDKRYMSMQYIFNEHFMFKAR